jgi:clan AA aspartic protease
MKIVYADVVLVNGEDEILAKRHMIGDDEVRKFPVNILVDSGSYMMAINEHIQEYLQLPVTDSKKAQMADHRIINCDVVSPIVLIFENRRFTGSALVLPGDCEPLLGTIPLEEMDVLIDPLRQQLIVNPEHPLYAQLKLK